MADTLNICLPSSSAFTIEQGQGNNVTANGQQDHRREAMMEAAVNRMDVSKSKFFCSEMGHSHSQKVFEILAAHWNDLSCLRNV